MCRVALDQRRGALRCASCRRRYPVDRGVPDLVLAERLTPEQRRLALDWDERSADYSAMVSALEPRRFEAIDWPLVDVARGHVLEVGCGDGRLLAKIASRATSVTGIDLSLAMARLAATAGLRVARALAEQLPFADASFDAVVSGYYALRYAQLDRALPEICRVTRPGGAVAFTLLGQRAVELRGRLAAVPLLRAPASRWLGARFLLGYEAISLPNDVRDGEWLRQQAQGAGLRLNTLLGVLHLPLLGARRWLAGDVAVNLGFDVIVLCQRDVLA